MKKIIIITLVLMVAVASTALYFIINNEPEGKMHTESVVVKSIASLSDATWQKLSKKKIYFGHQSVGYNILEGIKDLAKNNAIPVSVVETKDKSAMQKGGLYHSAIGKNLQPVVKIDDFKNAIENGIGSATDIAFFKLCYIDFNEQTKIDDIFEAYKTAIQDLQKQFPKTKFIHVTVPVKAEVNSAFKDKLKDFVKKLMGKTTNKDKLVKSNLVRHQYNTLLKSAFPAKDIFDLARFESTTKEGNEKASLNGGVKHFHLLKQYTTDGGHLNKPARMFIAEQLLVFLSRI